MEKFSISWDAPEYEHRPKESSWYWITIIVSLLMIGVAVWQQNWLFALFVIIAEALLIIWGNREPDEVRIVIDQAGVRIGDHKFYPRAHIEAFSIIEHGHTDWHDLIILLDRRLIPTVRIHIPEERVSALREVLPTLYPEYDHQESFVEILERYLWF